LIQVSTVIEATKKVSESMNIFFGDSSRKNNLINLFLDDPHMIHATTNEKVIEMLSIKHQPRKGRVGWIEEERHRSSARGKDAWEENATDFEACHGMPAKGTKEYNWKVTWLKVDLKVWMLR
jgi:hypothetical protein